MGYFSYAVAGELLEHLEDPHKFIKEVFRILKPGGILALSTPLDEAREPGAIDSERHLWSFKVDDIMKILIPYGKIKIAILRSQYFPTYQYHWPIILAWVKKSK